MEVTECGAASLTMILNALGSDVLLEEVREACAVSRDGVSASKIVEAARGYGLEAHGYRYDVGKLEALAPPFIVYWNQNHFLVVEGIGRRKVRLNDPASGRRSVSREEFVESYSGIVLVFSPGPGFQRASRRRRRPLLELLGLLSGSRSAVAYAVLAGIAVVVPTTVLAMLSAIFVSEVLSGRDTDWATKVVVLAGIVVLLQLCLSLFQQRVLLRLQVKLSIRMSAAFLWHLLRLPTRFFDARSPGGLVSRVQLNSQVAELLSGQLATAAISILTMVLYAVVLLVLNWLLALVAVGVASLNALMLLSVSRARVSVNQSLQQTLVRLGGYTFLGINMIDDIKATGSENDYFVRWAGSQARALNSEQRLGFLTQSLLVVPGFLTMLNTVVILAVGGALVITDHLGLPQLIVFQLLAVSFFAPISALVSVASRFQDARAWMQQIGDVMAQPVDEATAPAGVALDPAAIPHTAGDSSPDPGRTNGSRPEHRLSGRLELRGITFGYIPTEPPLIADLSVTVQPGQRVALVGATGSGKSTVANLVAGLVDPWSGEILFDGSPRTAIPREVMTASLAKVDQAIMLFSGTVADNIRFWDASVPFADVVAAAEDACIAEEIHSKPGGFSHHLAEGGRNLSGGQRQRLEFARALATNPSLLVLDEATSALDAVTEERVDMNLRRRGCTCLIIAHRLSTIRDCDQILVLERGRVAERGTHEDLLAMGGLYRELVSDG